MIAKSLLTDAESNVLNVKATVKGNLVTLAVTTLILIVTKRIMYSYRQLKAQRY
jgi:hypothetical protein